MKIKHFSGYGFVTAKRTSKSVHKDGSIKMTIRVEGNHERGLETYDTYDAVNWLLKKFDKKVENDLKVESCEKVDVGEFNHTTRNWDDKMEYTFVYRY